jgi:UDP-N-acetylmuramoyl-L-alanyl-D-glutamate--2,6-diaminopimelate ligase
MLGRVAAELADHVVITDEDPRGEDPRGIADEIVEGGRGVKTTSPFDVVLDRRAAIRHALGLARAGDTVLLTGKGHESSIIYADRDEPWDERAVALEELAAAGYEG